MTAAVWAIAAVMMVAILAFTEMQKAKHRARHGITKDWLGSELPPDHPSRLPPTLVVELSKEVEELRERVKVLERIATDGRESKLLSAEIESLREK